MEVGEPALRVLVNQKIGLPPVLAFGLVRSLLEPRLPRPLNIELKEVPRLLVPCLGTGPHPFPGRPRLEPRLQPRHEAHVQREDVFPTVL